MKLRPVNTMVLRGALDVNAAAPFSSASLWVPPTGLVGYLEHWSLRSLGAVLAEVAICDGDRSNVLDAGYALGLGLAESPIGTVPGDVRGWLIQAGICVCADTVTTQGRLAYRMQIGLYDPTEDWRPDERDDEAPINAPHFQPPEGVRIGADTELEGWS